MQRRLGVALLLMLLLTTQAQAATRFIAPNGTGGGDGDGTSTSTPWKFFGNLVNLTPGDTLIVMDGTYTPSANGNGQRIISMDCQSSGVDGAPDNPITIRAQSERQAHLMGIGYHVVYFTRCHWWNIEGLHVQNVLTGPGGGGGEGAVIELEGFSHFTLKKNLIVNPNYCHNIHPLVLYGRTQVDGYGPEDLGQGSLIEENEIYKQIYRHGIALGDAGKGPATGITIRRNYIYSQHAPLPNPPNPTDCGSYNASSIHEADTGGEGISCYPCRDTTVENNIVEAFITAYTGQCEWDCINNAYLGNISLQRWYWGWGHGPRCEQGGCGTERVMPTDYVIENHLIVNQGGPTASGITAVKRGHQRNISVLDNYNSAGSFGVSGGGSDGDGDSSVTTNNMLVIGGGAWTAAGVVTWSHTHSMFFETDNAFNPPLTDARYSNIDTTTNPALGTCKVYIPETSNAKGVGVGGTWPSGASAADIGANIVYRYQDRVLTDVPLWDPVTSRFAGCGVEVPGVNDDPNESCKGVHTRLNVNANGCTVPLTGGGGYTPTVDTYHLTTSGTQTDCDLAKSSSTPYSVVSQSALAQALHCGLGGSTYVFHAGAYPPIQGTVTPIPAGTSTTARTTLTRFGTDVVTFPGGIWLDGANTQNRFLTFDGFLVDLNNTGGAGFVIWPSGGQDIVLQNMEIRATPQEGIYVENVPSFRLFTSRVGGNTSAAKDLIDIVSSPNTILRGNMLDTAAGHGLVIDNSSSPTLVEQNRIRNNAQSGLVAGTGTKAYNNLVWQNGTGIQILSGASGVQVYYNTVQGSTTTSLLVETGVTTSEVTNNIFWAPSAITNNAGAGVTFLTNTCTGIVGCATADPLFASTTPGDPNFLHLQPVPPATTPVSPARNSGTTIASLTSDFAGNPRPRSTGGDTGVDKGAFEELPVVGGTEPPPVSIGIVPPFMTTHFLVPQP